MLGQRILVVLIVALFFPSLLLVVKAQNEASIWTDSMKYSGLSQFQAAGWASSRPAGLNFTGTSVILDGQQADTSISYSKFPSGIYSWKVEDRNRWIAGSHSGQGVGVSTDKHSYSFAVDGWYTDFAFYRDGQKILMFGSYQEKINDWITLDLVKQGNTIDMYFNNQLENSYIENDTTPQQLTSYGSSNPWLGAAEYNYVQVWSLSPTVTSTPETSTGSFTFKAWIDGYDYLYVQGGGSTVQYYHIHSDPPGFAYNNLGAQYNLQHHDNRPTYVDGNPWYPTWANISSSATTWIDVQSLSDVYMNSGQHPAAAWNITGITNVVARDNLTLAEYPSASNNYTAKFVLDDWTFLLNGTNPTGAAWYSFTMNWETNGPLTQSVSEVTKTAWVPPIQNAVGTVALACAALGAFAVVAFAASSAETAVSAASGGFAQTVIEKIRGIMPDAFKKWLEDLIASKRKLKIDEKKGSPYLPTKPEIAVYAISIILLTISFSYVKVSTLEQFLIVLPTFFATSILVSLVRTYIGTLYSRRKGVWTEYKLWYFGIGLFVLSTFALKVPFSSPTRTVHHSKNFTDRLGGELSILGILITLAFAGFFFALMKGGLILIGGSGLAMCIIGAFFDCFPLEPMGGRDVYKYNKLLWVFLFLVTLLLYAVWLAHAM